MLLVICFVKSRNAIGSLGTIVGTLIGFLTGVYIAIGQLPDAVGWAIRLFPTSHAASMFRQLLAGNTLNNLGVPAEFVDFYNEFYGITFSFGTFTTDFFFSALFLIGTSVIFYSIALCLAKRQSFE